MKFVEAYAYAYGVFFLVWFFFFLREESEGIELAYGVFVASILTTVLLFVMTESEKSTNHLPIYSYLKPSILVIESLSFFAMGIYWHILFDAGAEFTDVIWLSLITKIGMGVGALVMP
jgi:hypothetical protein